MKKETSGSNNIPTNEAAEGVSTTDELAQRAAHLERLTKEFCDPYTITNFNRTHNASGVKQEFAHLSPGEETDSIVSIAGRIMAIRNGGMFIDVLDETDRLQVFHNLKSLDEKQKRLLELIDLGDIIGVKGHVRRTPRGELSVAAHEMTVLAKATEPPPEKYHGLKNIEFRFRHREQDLVATPQARTTLRSRYRMAMLARQYLYGKGWLEVETPMLHVIAGGALAKPFITHHNALDMQLFLRIAPELHLKRLAIGGLADKIFELNRCFRNEGLSPKHNPEFTTIELYQNYADFTDMMDLTEALVSHIAISLHGSAKVQFQGRELDFTPPWPRKTMCQLVREITGVDFEKHHDTKEAYVAAAKAGVKLEEGYSWGQVVEAVFSEKVEKEIFQPIHVTDLPKDISPLAKSYADRPWLARRFESFANGWEIANGFSELNDPREQRRRFEEQAEQKRGPDEPPHPIDEDFLMALGFGMPPMGGLGIGFDRLAMLLTDSTSIREVISFPTMRPEHGDENKQRS